MGSFAKLAKRAVETEAPVTVKIQELLRGTNGAMSLAQGVVYGQPPEAALNKVKEIVWEPSISKYGSDDGLPELRELREALLEKAVNMSVNALKDLNVPQSAELEKTKDNSVKSCITKPVLNSNRCVNKAENAPPACPDAATNAVTNGCESGNADVEYIDSENLTDLRDVDASLSTLVARLDSKDWVMTCEALNNVRQLALLGNISQGKIAGAAMATPGSSSQHGQSFCCNAALSCYIRCGRTTELAFAHFPPSPHSTFGRSVLLHHHKACKLQDN